LRPELAEAVGVVLEVLVAIVWRYARHSLAVEVIFGLHVVAAIGLELQIVACAVELQRPRGGEVGVEAEAVAGALLTVLVDEGVVRIESSRREVGVIVPALIDEAGCQGHLYVAEVATELVPGVEVDRLILGYGMAVLAGVATGEEVHARCLLDEVVGLSFGADIAFHLPLLVAVFGEVVEAALQA